MSFPGSVLPANHFLILLLTMNNNYAVSLQTEIDKLEYRASISGEAYLDLGQYRAKILALNMRKGFKYFYYREDISGKSTEITREELINLINNNLKILDDQR